MTSEATPQTDQMYRSVVIRHERTGHEKPVLEALCASPVLRMGEERSRLQLLRQRPKITALIALIFLQTLSPGNLIAGCFSRSSCNPGSKEPDYANYANIIDSVIFGSCLMVELFVKTPAAGKLFGRGCRQAENLTQLQQGRKS